MHILNQLLQPLTLPEIVQTQEPRLSLIFLILVQVIAEDFQDH